MDALRHARSNIKSILSKRFYDSTTGREQEARGEEDTIKTNFIPLHEEISTITMQGLLSIYPFELNDIYNFISNENFHYRK